MHIFIYKKNSAEYYINEEIDVGAERLQQLPKYRSSH